jgi:hypothetical protein
MLYKMGTWGSFHEAKVHESEDDYSDVKTVLCVFMEQCLKAGTSPFPVLNNFP